MTALCQCGCGLPAPIPTHSNASKGWVKGEPRPYRAGHDKRKPIRWLEEDRGHTTPCWIWQLLIGTHGYGRGWRNGTVMQAHRAVYEEFRGPIPTGLDLDHLCRVRACVNPDHLEPVTRGENLRRGAAARNRAAA